MGELSLRVLVYMGERHSPLLRRLVAMQINGDREYPLCASVVNLVASCAALVGLGARRKAGGGGNGGGR
jgi:hypothetical protein